MDTQRITGTSNVRRGVPALVAALVSAAVAGGSPAVAAAYTGGTAAREPDHTATAGVISTIAGGVGGPGKATKVALFNPCGVSFGAGRLYIGDNSVRRVNPQTDRLTTPAGTGNTGPIGDGGPAAQAGLAACGTAVDHSGNLVIADWFDSRIRVVAARTSTFYGQNMTAGDIYTVAGNGTAGFSGDGGPATGAKLAGPFGVTVDAAGNLVIADTGNSRIRVVAARTSTFYGQNMTAGDIYTVAGSQVSCANGPVAGSGDAGTATPATQAALCLPQRVAVDAAGNLVIADTVDLEIQVVAVKTGTFYGQNMTAGEIYIVAGDGLTRFSGDGGPATRASVNRPYDVVVDATGNLVITDTFHNRIRVVAARTGTFYGQNMTAGDIYTVAGGGHHSGDSVQATRAMLNRPEGVAVDTAGNLLIADTVESRVQLVAARTGTFYVKKMTAGEIYTVAGNGTGSSGDGGPATHAELDEPANVTADDAGNLVIADRISNRIRVVAARTGTFYGYPMTGGDIYTVAGTGKRGFSGDGGPATHAKLALPRVGLDTGGNLVIGDQGNNRVRVVAAHTATFYGQAMTVGHIYTVAGTGAAGFSGDGGPATSAELNNPEGVAADGAGNLLIADAGSARIRVVAARTGTFYGKKMTAGDIYTVAGGGRHGLGDSGPATSAELNSPAGVAADGAGNLLIADLADERIRVVAARTGTFYGKKMTAGDIYTVAGNGNIGYSGDGGPGTNAGLYDPEGVAADTAGNLLIADTNDGRIRVVAGRTGTSYGQPMTVGDIYTIAGNGDGGAPGGFSGDGGPATSAELSQPGDIALGTAGSLLIADSGNGRVRLVMG